MRIGQLPSVASDQLSDYAAVEQSGATLKTTLQSILNLFKANIAPADIGALPDTTTPADIGATAADLLWTNPSPTSSFAAQTVSLDLSGYDSVVIDFRFNSSTGRFVRKLGRVGEEMYADMSYNYFGWRNVSVQTSGVTFTAYSYYTSYGGGSASSTADAMIPVRIFGIKGF